MVKILNIKNITDSTSLSFRIKFNKKYSKYNFDDWLKENYEFKKNYKILDVGCGDGKQIKLAKKKIGKFGEITGIDLSKESIEKIKRKNKKKIQLINCSMDNINFIEKLIRNKSFDLIHSTYAIYYSKNPLKLLNYLKKKLKKKSKLIITVPGEKNTLKELLKIKEDKKKLKKNEIENFFINNFDNVKINILNNYLDVNNFSDIINFYKSSGIYNRKKLNFFSKTVKKKLIKYKSFKIYKSSMMFIGAKS